MLSRMPNVLLVGFDPHTVPGVDAALVDSAIAMGNARFANTNLAVDTCLFPLDPETAERMVITALAAKDYACVVIGGGLRKPDDLVALFERVLAAIHKHAPGAAIAFNTNPVTSFDAARRWIPA
jgi:hypothetical protein